MIYLDTNIFSYIYFPWFNISFLLFLFLFLFLTMKKHMAVVILCEVIGLDFMRVSQKELEE